MPAAAAVRDTDAASLRSAAAAKRNRNGAVVTFFTAMLNYFAAMVTFLTIPIVMVLLISRFSFFRNFRYSGIPSTGRIYYSTNRYSGIPWGRIY